MLAQPLFEQAARQPHELAIIDDRGTYSYRDVATMATALGAYFGTLTDRPRLGLLLPSSVGFVASFYGALIAGKAVVPLNFLLGDGELAHCMRDSGIDTLITIPPLAARLKDAPLKVVDLTQLPPVPAATASVAASSLPSPPFDQLAVLMYTSGTSGMPKGVMLSHGNIKSNVDAAIQHAALERRHRFLGIIPLFHVFGMTGTMLAPLQLGATIVYMARFNPAATLKAIREHRLSIVMGVPSMFAAIARLKDASREDFKSIYAAISGGEPLSTTLGDTYRDRFGVTLYDAYGMTETSLAVSLNTPKSHRPGSAGKAVPGLQVKIVDDGQNELPSGESGEILLRGPMVTKGYHNLPDETAAAFTPDGYFRTGDLGRIDPDGFIHITGRKKDLIIVAGEKVSPSEIEQTLLLHAAVADAAVVGRKDTIRGESVVAFVSIREGQSVAPEELREFCRSQGMPQWKIPREVQILQEIPRSPTGKILKRTLVEPPAR